MYHVINYDLHRPDQNYEALYAFFKRFDHRKVSDSCWVLKTDLPAYQLLTMMSQFFDRDDQVSIFDFHHCASTNLPPEVASWLPR